jgi:hypothetical protein
VVLVVGYQSVLDLSYHPLTKFSKIGPKKTRFKVFVVFAVGVCCTNDPTHVVSSESWDQCI